jgi:2-phosphosulfolactate phosphatase
VTPTVVIDTLPESAARYRSTHVIVAVDVFRATTSILTALAAGHRVFPVASVVEALRIAGVLDDPVLAGEQGGLKPGGFDLNNSPAAIDRLADRRPVVLLTSAGTQLLAAAAGAEAVYVACLRNWSATAEHLASHHRRVALIGAGTRGESRPEDQLVCAWIGAQLLAEGFTAENQETIDEMARWARADLAIITRSPSATYLRETRQEEDLYFVMTHLDDVAAIATYDGREVKLRPVRAGELYQPAVAAQA